MEWFYPGADPAFATAVGASTEQIGDIAVTIAPYSRDPRSSSAVVQSLDARSIPRAQVKYFNARLYYPTIYADPIGGDSNNIQNQGLCGSASYFRTQPQMVKCTNENPQYAVQPLAQTNILGGEVYSNHPLALLSAAGRDNTNWHCFVLRCDHFDQVSRNITVRGNCLFRVNVTFEGIRWNPANLFLEPSQPFCDDVQTQSRDVTR